MRPPRRARNYGYFASGSHPILGPGWEWATNGRFPGRWDDPSGNFRTVYAGSTLLACIFEVLASFRKDARLAAEMDEIEEDPADHVLHPTIPLATVPRDWLDARIITSAHLRGGFYEVTDSMSLAFLYPQFIGRALQLGLDEFDAAALKDSRARPLTQAVASWVFESTDLDGIAFASRHGDDLKLRAVFERSADSTTSPLLHDIYEEKVHHESSDIVAALDLLGLSWQAD